MPWEINKISKSNIILCRGIHGLEEKIYRSLSITQTFLIIFRFDTMFAKNIYSGHEFSAPYKKSSLSEMFTFQKKKVKCN